MQPYNQQVSPYPHSELNVALASSRGTPGWSVTRNAVTKLYLTEYDQPFVSLSLCAFAYFDSLYGVKSVLIGEIQ